MNAWQGHGLAFVASVLYFAGFGFFKCAAARMEPLAGTRPIHLATRVLASGPWWCGTAFMLGGVAFHLAALFRNGPETITPALLAGLVVLLAVARALFNEHVTWSEWLAFGLLFAAGLCLTQAAGSTWRSPSPGLLPILAITSFVLPAGLFALGDRQPAGLHARRLNGIAYGICAGVLIGLGELSLILSVRHGIDGELLTSTAYPYLFAAAVGAGVVQLQIALQRCRMVVLIFVATVVAKTYVLLAGTPLADPASWPSPAHMFAGVALLAAAFALVPRFDSAVTEGGGPGPSMTTGPRADACRCGDPQRARSRPGEATFPHAGETVGPRAGSPRRPRRRAW
ncbi:hypothetical protein GCM10023085_64760 [Actinomadura viridis]|uniref:Uncharacterized protein n=1 Tax=Actinomadura viridis TaxID=58110 RepID=A0A931GMW4_9ACTN|nr:hypothetical protein [Actinomadura viridis]MBG6093107.1 hypothetical protein [Actinomadura viridis]